MSRILNVVTTEFRVKGNQATAAMGSMAGGMQQIGQQINENTRMSERFGQQWRAIGTTVRYALAGGVVFGLRSVVDQMKEIQNQMGLISAIGSIKGGSGAIVGQNLTDLMAQARSGAVESITPLTDYNNAIINILSTVQNIPKNEIVPMVTEISKAATLAQISAEDATKAFTTMNISFGKKATLGNIHRTAQEFFILTKEAPGGTVAGQQIITQLGQMAAVTKAAGGTQEDIFSMYLSGLRGGIPPAQLGRGLQYMIQTLALPGSQSHRSKAALASVGITPGKNLTLQQRISRVMAKARRLGLRGDMARLGKLDPDTLEQFDAMGQQGVTDALHAAGISGRGTEFLGQAFPRIHALRAALAIQTQLDAGQAQKDFEIMTAAASGHVKAVDDLAKAWKKFSDQAKLQAATIALSAMGQQVATIFAPVLNFVASQEVNAFKFLSHHRHGTKNAVELGLGLTGALATTKFLTGVGPLGLLKGLTGVQAAQAALTGGGGKTVMNGLGNSPENPLYVTVVNQLFGRGGRVPGEGDPLPTTISRIKARLPKIFPPAITGPLFLASIPFWAGGDSHFQGYAPKGGTGALNKYEHSFGKPGVGMANIYVQYQQHKISAAVADRMLRTQQILDKQSPNHPQEIMRLFKTTFENINGKPHVALDLKLKYPNGKEEPRQLFFQSICGLVGLSHQARATLDRGNK